MILRRLLIYCSEDVLQTFAIHLNPLTIINTLPSVLEQLKLYLQIFHSFSIFKEHDGVSLLIPDAIVLILTTHQKKCIHWQVNSKYIRAQPTDKPYTCQIFLEQMKTISIYMVTGLNFGAKYNHSDASAFTFSQKQKV